jgi:hypothetical protein
MLAAMLMQGDAPVQSEGRMKVEGGGWRVEGGGWRVEGGGFYLKPIARPRDRKVDRFHKARKRE